MQTAHKATDLQQALLPLIKEKHGQALQGVFLFGSQARGDARPFSDINLLVLTESESEDSCLFAQGELVRLHAKTLSGFLAELYAPTGRQVIDWWLLAGNVQHAVPWQDSTDLLPVARRMLQQRKPLIDLHSRILWDGQMQQLTEWQRRLEQAEPFTGEYLRSVAGFLEDAEKALLIYHGDILPRRDLALLPRPRSFLSDWATVWCLGVEPRRVDLGACADAVARVVRGIWQAAQPELSSYLDSGQIAARQLLLDRVPSSGTAAASACAGSIAPAIVDKCLSILWGTVKHLLQRDGARMLALINQLWILIVDFGLPLTGEMAELMHLARIPAEADPAQVTAAVHHLRLGLESIGQTPTILPPSGKQAAR